MNGSEALEKLEQNSDVCIVLSDIDMPEMDGLTTAKNHDPLGNVTIASIESTFWNPQMELRNPDKVLVAWLEPIKSTRFYDYTSILDSSRYMASDKTLTPLEVSWLLK